MKRPAVVVRVLEFAVVIAREFGRIPHYNAEGERLLRVMRNHGQHSPNPGRARIFRRVLNRVDRDQAAGLA